MTRLSLLFLAPLAGVPILGCESATESPRTRFSEIRLDLGEVLRPSLGTQQGIAVSVIDSVTLTVEGEDGSSAFFSEELEPGQDEVFFPVEVDPGLVMFSSAVLSNNGTVLYSGSTEDEIVEDGFQVVIQMEAVAPVMVAFPDSIQLDQFGQGSFEIMNRGNGTLTWQAVAPSDTCRVIGTTDVFESCLLFEVKSGMLEAGESDQLFVFSPADTTDTFDFALGSGEGSVTVMVSVDAPPPAQLAFPVQPTQTEPGDLISPPVEVAIQDFLGRTVVTAQQVVTLSLGVNTGGGMLFGDLSVAAVDGVAVFANLSIDEMGTYTLRAVSGSLTPAESDMFSVQIPEPD